MVADPVKTPAPAVTLPDMTALRSDLVAETVMLAALLLTS
jgi:hypothetical protein